MGKPEYLSAAMVNELNEVSLLRREPVSFDIGAETLALDVTMPPQSVAAIQSEY
jgi:hypothetical protein